jgi:transcriptional regulator with GAF, ATPase, and Fis domain
MEVLKRSQNPSATQRLIGSAAIVIDAFEAADSHGSGSEEQSWEGFAFKKEVHDFQKQLLERALRDAGGLVSKASRLLGFKHHQSVISLLNTRHQELLKTRSVARKRRRHSLETRN